MIGEPLKRPFESPHLNVPAGFDRAELLGVTQSAPAHSGKVDFLGLRVGFGDNEELIDFAHAPSIGNFTALSTAILPDAVSLISSNLTGMDLPEVLFRIQQRLRTLEMTADAASKAAGKPDAIRNLKRAVDKGGRKGISTDTLNALAVVLRTTPAWLLGQDEDIRSEDVAASLERPPRPAVKIKGYVGAGAEMHYYRYSDEDFEEVDAPAGASAKTVAVQIKGKSWGPRMDGWLVFYDDVRSPITEDMFNQPCIVGLADDRILLKTIKHERDGTFTLLSNSDEPPILNAQIEWAAKVIGMKPR